MVRSRWGGVGSVGFALLVMTGCGGLLETEAGERGADGQGPPATSSAVQRDVDPAKELVIVDPSVIESPEETTFDAEHPSGRGAKGAWTFGRLVHNMLPAGSRDDRAAASRFVMSWLGQWQTPQSPNPAASPADARPNIAGAVIGPWRIASGCAAADESCVLDMGKAPFLLVAIVNRPDLRHVADDDTAIGGEGRFVFQLTGPTLGRNVVGGPIEIIEAASSPQKLTVIFEYTLPVKQSAETLSWASRWHDLGKRAFGASFNADLRSITSDFSGPDSDARRPNGNALNQLRTNEVATMGARRFGSEAPLSTPQIWELREFRISGVTGQLVQTTVNLEPSRDFDIARAASVAATFRAPFGTRGAELASWLVANGDAVIASKHVVPHDMAGNSSLVGAGGFGPWGKLATTSAHTFSTAATATAPAVRVDDAVRDKFALDTCAGCHRHETGTNHFMHVSDRRAIDAVDQTTLALPAATTPAEERAVILSTFLKSEIAPPSVELPAGGPRFADFNELLAMKPKDLRGARGRRPCR